MEYEWVDFKTGSEKKIYFLIDTCHSNQGVQNSLYGAAKEQIDTGIFETIFLEAPKGKLENLCDNEEYVRRFFRDNYNMTLARHLLADHYKNNLKIQFYGVEDNAYEKEEQEYYKKLTEYLSKKNLSEKEKSEHIELDRRLSDIGWWRNDRAVANSIEYMNQNNIKTAGLIFGSEHFTQMYYEFKGKGIGMIAYEPKIIEISEKENLKFVQFLLQNK